MARASSPQLEPKTCFRIVVDTLGNKGEAGEAGEAEKARMHVYGVDKCIQIPSPVYLTIPEEFIIPVLGAHGS